MYQYTSSTSDIANRKTYMKDGRVLVEIDIDGWAARRYTLDSHLTDIQFDQNTRQFFGIKQENGNHVVVVDHELGTSKHIASFERTMGVYLGESTFDSVNGRYFIQAGPGGGRYCIVVIDTRAGEQIAQFEIPKLINGMRYDSAVDALIGVVNNTLVAVDPKSGSIKQLPIALPKGTPALFTSIAHEGNYMTIMQYLTEYRWMVSSRQIRWPMHLAGHVRL